MILRGLFRVNDYGKSEKVISNLDNPVTTGSFLDWMIDEYLQTVQC